MGVGAVAQQLSALKCRLTGGGHVAMVVFDAWSIVFTKLYVMICRTSVTTSGSIFRSGSR